MDDRQALDPSCVTRLFQRLVKVLEQQSLLRRNGILPSE
jgi:hypothetical protein